MSYPIKTNRYPSVKAIYPEKGKNMCHPGVIKKLIFNLNKMRYTDHSTLEEHEQFYKQYRIIYDIFYKYWIDEPLDWTPDTRILFRLFDTLKPPDACISRSVQINLSITTNGVIFDFEPNEILEEIGKCDKRYILFDFGIINYNNKNDNHANLIVFDKKLKNAYRIEPNYGFGGNYDHLIDPNLTTGCKSINYSYKGFLPSSCKRIYHMGFCVILSIVKYIHHEITNELLRKVIVNFFKSEYNRVCKKELVIN